MMELFARGGWPTYALLCFAFVSHPLALAALVLGFTQRRRGGAIGLGAASLLLGVLALLLGVGGYLWGMHQVNEALAYAGGSAELETLRAYGQQEAMISVWCALASCALPFLCGGLALARGLTLPKGGA